MALRRFGRNGGWLATAGLQLAKIALHYVGVAVEEWHLAMRASQAKRSADSSLNNGSVLASLRSRWGGERVRTGRAPLRLPSTVTRRWRANVHQRASSKESCMFMPHAYGMQISHAHAHLHVHVHVHVHRHLRVLLSCEIVLFVLCCSSICF